MKVDVLLGMQWGDEGKGKIVDVLTPQYDIIARFQGGPNAGHTLEFNNIKHVLHTIPSGIFRPKAMNVIGSGVVVDPVILREEIESAMKLGADLHNNLLISKKAHLIMPSHRLLDKAYEEYKGASKIGSTQKGIGPTYTDRTARIGLRMGEMFSPDFLQKYNTTKAHHLKVMKGYNFTETNEEYEKQWFEAVEYLKTFNFIDSEIYVNKALNEGKSILAEGAQGSMLDIDYGSYPFVTSSNTLASGVCSGLGVAPSKIGKVYGIVKAYCTRVGSGPFPTELFDETGNKIRHIGHEYGAVTGRERRCGWIDLVALRYSIMVNGVTQLIMMKSDVLDQFDTIKACVAYRHNGQVIKDFPYNIEDDIEPVYEELPGWRTDMTRFTSEAQFPQAFKDYISFLEAQLETPITIISIGPDREQTIVR